MDSLSYAVDIFNYVILAAGIGFTILALFALLFVGKRISQILIKSLKVFFAIVVMLILYRFAVITQIFFLLLKIGVFYYAVVTSLFYCISFVSIISIFAIIGFIVYGQSNKRMLIIKEFRGRNKFKDSPDYIGQSFLKLSPVLVQ